MTTTTKRPTDAELVKLLRESGAILRKLQLELSGEEFINSPDNRFDVAADALEAPPADPDPAPKGELDAAGAALHGALEDVAHAAAELFDVCTDHVTVQDLHDFLAEPVQAWKDAGDAYLTAVRRDALAQSVEEAK